MAALDVLALGPFVFTDFAVPEMLPVGGKQQLRVHKLPGGDRVVDAMGPDDDDRVFSVLHVGSTAIDDALTIDAMRISGQPYPYSNGVEARIVVIAAAPFKVEKFNVVHQDITVTPVDNPAGSQGASSSPDDLISSDGTAGQDVIASNAGAYPVTTPAPTLMGGVGGIPVANPSAGGGIGSA